MLQNEDVCEKKLILTEEFENLRFDCFFVSNYNHVFYILGGSYGVQKHHIICLKGL